jgi:hypothetical protein
VRPAYSAVENEICPTMFSRVCRLSTTLKEVAYQGTWLLLVRGAVGVLIAPVTTLLAGSLFPPVEAVGLAFALCFPAIPKVRLVLGGRLSLYGAIWLDGKIL